MTEKKENIEDIIALYKLPEIKGKIVRHPCDKYSEVK